MYCLNCGEDFYNCTCIPWCWKHDSSIPCSGCVHEAEVRREKAEMLAPFLVPWYTTLFNMFLGE